jgi:hypothetical protein
LVENGGCDGEVDRVIMNISGFGALANDTVKTPCCSGVFVAWRIGARTGDPLVGEGKVGAIDGGCFVLVPGLKNPPIAMINTIKNNTTATARRNKLNLLVCIFMVFL